MAASFEVDTTLGLWLVTRFGDGGCWFLSAAILHLQNMKFIRRIIDRPHRQ